MKNLKSILKKTGRVSMLESIIFAILGIILICRPEGTLKFITYILGTIFIIIGVHKTVNYFTSKGKNDFFNYDLTYGLMAIVIGIITITYMNIIGSIFRIIIGIWILYTSLVRLNLALQIKKLGNTAWIYSLIIAIFIFICGLYTIINTGVIIVTIGIIMLIYAALDIIENVIFMKNVDRILK